MGDSRKVRIDKAKTENGNELDLPTSGSSLVSNNQIANFETTTQLNNRDTANRVRANHTGTQVASTISDFDNQVRNVELDISDKAIFNNVITTQLDAVEYFKGITQTTINRIARIDINYTNGNITSEVRKTYSQADGTTILKTRTITYTYTNGEVTAVSVTEV